MTGIQIPGTGTITYNAYKWNRPLSITLPGGSKKEYDYDPLMRVKSITSQDPGQNILLNYTYSYDRMDNIKTKATEHGPYVYAYDDLYRLTTVHNPTLPDESYTYDPVGNRLTSSNAADWTYNPNNELQSYDGISFEYDLNGNTIQKTDGDQVTNYIYNIEDRLARVEDGSDNVIASYYYDPFGRRLWKEAAGTRTFFLYAEEGLIGEYDETGSQTTAHGYAPNSPSTTNPVFMKQGAQYYFYHNDHLGTPQKMTSANGSVVWSAKYESFGKAEIDSASTLVNNLRFPGQYYDHKTGIHYNFHRYYNPENGKYLRPDPIGMAADYNVYLYARSAPTNHFDPTGQLWWLAGALVGASIDLSVQLILGGELDWVSVGASAVSGATGVGLGSAVARITTRFGGRLAFNAFGSAAIGSSAKLVQNYINGDCLTDDVLKTASISALTGGIGFAAGHLTEKVGRSIAWRSSSISDKLLITSNAIAVPSSHRSIYVGIGNAIGITVSNTSPAVERMVP